MLITEAELREYWQNGRGQIPAFPPGTRFTPSAQDFLKSMGLIEGASPSAQDFLKSMGLIEGASPSAQDFLKSLGLYAGSEPAAPTPAPATEVLLQSPPGRRLIITAQEVDSFIPPGTQKVILHPSVTLTDAAREKLRAAGVRILPYIESAPPPAPAQPPVDNEALFNQVKSAVLARLDAPVDEAVLDAVLRKVLASLSV